MNPVAFAGRKESLRGGLDDPFEDRSVAFGEAIHEGEADLLLAEAAVLAVANLDGQAGAGVGHDEDEGREPEQDELVSDDDEGAVEASGGDAIAAEVEDANGEVER